MSSSQRPSDRSGNHRPNHAASPLVPESFPAALRDLAAKVLRKLVMRPEDYDCLLLPNLYGDIVSDLAAGLVGGLGMTPGANIGDELAVFEAVHGSAPDIAGRNLANPTALIQSGVLMLEHMGLREPAVRVRRALRAVLAAGIRTGDLGGEVSTTAFTEALVRAIEAG